MSDNLARADELDDGAQSQFQKLQSLRDEGILTEAEFETKAAELEGAPKLYVAPEPPTATPARSRRKWPWVVALVVLLAGAAVVGYQQWQERQERQRVAAAEAAYMKEAGRAADAMREGVEAFNDAADSEPTFGDLEERMGEVRLEMNGARRELADLKPPAKYAKAQEQLLEAFTAFSSASSSYVSYQRGLSSWRSAQPSAERNAEGIAASMVELGWTRDDLADMESVLDGAIENEATYCKGASDDDFCVSTDMLDEGRRLVEVNGPNFNADKATFNDHASSAFAAYGFDEKPSIAVEDADVAEGSLPASFRQMLAVALVEATA